MAEYIEREAAIDAVKKERNYTGKFTFEEEHAWAVGFQQGITFALSDIAAIPAADVRPVVMCCDCKHFQVNISPSGYLPQGVPEWECRYWLRPTDPTDFCSYGEKWEES